MTDAFVFDLDNTLFDRDQAYRAFLEMRLGPFDEATWREIERLDASGHGPRKPVAKLVSNLARHRGVAWSADDICEDTRTQIAKFATLPEGVHEALERMRAQRNIALITNGSSANQRRKIVALGLAAHFDLILVSEEFGARKPDVSIFRAALERIGVDGKNATMVGDHPEQDIGGARRAGMNVVWVANSRSWKPEWGRTPERIIDSPAEIPGLT